MTDRVAFTPRARADAIEAFRWLAERSPDAAARWYAGLERAVAAERDGQWRLGSRSGLCYDDCTKTELRI